MTADQFTFDDAAAARDDALARGEDHADTAWLRTAREVVYRLAAQRRRFTADDVVDQLEQQGVSTHDGRALGGVIRAMARDGVITKTGTYTPTRRASGHAGPRAEWIGGAP